MNSVKVYEQIRKTVNDCLPGARILLFGSRARSDGDRFSDYDLLIITKETFTPRGKIKWISYLDRAIVTAIKAPVDVLLNSENEVIQKLELPGHIIRMAVREGVAMRHLP